MDFTIGRKGFLAYLKSLGGSNIIKVVPSASVSASPTSPVIASKGCLVEANVYTTIG